MLSILASGSARLSTIHRDMLRFRLDRFIRSLEKNVAVHADCEFIAGRNLDRWLYILVWVSSWPMALPAVWAGVGYVRALWLLLWEISNAAVNMLVRTEKPIRRR